jgi:hypothetical protein
VSPTSSPPTPSPTSSPTEFCRLFGEVNCFIEGTRKECTFIEPPQKECFCENGVESILFLYGGIDSGYVKCNSELYGPFNKGDTFSIVSPPGTPFSCTAADDVGTPTGPSLMWMHLVMVVVI